MSWLLTIITLAGVWFFAMILGLIAPPTAKTVIKIHNGHLHITRGQLRAQPREFVTEILQQANVTNGFIAITHSKHTTFSRNIPRDIQQRLRNVLLND